MKPAAALLYANPEEEISALIATLYATGQRLEELTGGEAGAVADRGGDAFLLRHAQHHLAKQAAVLDALPVQIAVIDPKGVILTVNEAWRQFAGANGLQHPGHAVGLNYLEICDHARGSGAVDAHAVAEGLRAVLAGAQDFSFEYPCHAPTGPRWFLMHATPLAGAVPHDAVVMHVNITERKLAEDAMRASQISMAAAQAIAHFGSWELDLGDQVELNASRLRWSDEMFRIAGYTPGEVEVSKEFFFSLVPAEEHEAIREAIGAAIRDRGPYSVTHRLIRSDGTKRVVHERGDVVFHEKTGTPLKVIGTAHDITDRKKAEEAVQRGQKRLRNLIDGLGPSMFVALLTPEGTVIEINHPPLAAAGLKSEDVLGQPFAETPWWHTPESRQQLREAIARAAHGESSRYDVRVQGARGKIIDVDFSIQPLRDETGQIAYLIPSGTVITERKTAEEALRESEERFRGTFEQVAVGIAHVSTEGRFLRVNDRLCAIVGYGGAELLDMTFMELTLPEDRAASEEARLAMLAGSQSSYTSEKRYRRKSGELVWVNLATTLERTPAGTPKYFISIFDEITERKQMEESLHRSQALLRMAGRLSRMGPWSVELPGERVMWSEEVCAIHEMPPGTAPTVEEALNYFTPDSRQIVARAFETCTRDGTPYDLELEIITRTGRRVWVRTICEVERDGAGVIRRVQGNLQDIHDLKLVELKLSRANDELRESEEKFRQLADNITDVFWITSPDFHTIHFVSPGYELIWGRSMESLYARPHQWFDAIVPEDRERVRTLLATLTDGAPTVNVEYRIARPDGTVRWIHDHGFQVRDAGGHLVRLTGIARDITERKEAEQHMAEQAALIDESRDAIFVSDLDRRITFWSKGAERLYGWSAAEAKGCTVHKLLQVDADRFHAADRTVRETGEWNGEIQKTARSGTVLTVDGRWTLMRDTQGLPHSILSVDTDVTERKKAEKQVLRSQRMESIGTLAGGIAHDLNNVLAPILMGVDYLKSQYPEASGILDRFESSANRGAGMVRQLLTFAKGAEGERVSIQLTHLVMEIKALMLGTFPKNIEVVVTCAPGLPTVLGDATQLHQILLNLCVNARDAMPSGGTLTLEAQKLEVDALYAAAVPDARAGTYVTLRVRDTGTGIPAEIIDQIFDPFFTTKGPDKGTGLGLSTVMGIVKGMGGFLQVSSTPGQGSTFVVYLPAETTVGATAASGEVEPSLRGRGETILLVDDEEGVLEVGTVVLRGLNYKVVTALDGAEGLVKLVRNKQEIRAIITDMHMPHMDGLAFVRAVRQVLPDVPVIMGSGRLDDSVAEELKELGVHDRLDKPYTQQMLGAMIARLVAGTDTAGG